MITQTPTHYEENDGPWIPWKLGEVDIDIAANLIHIRGNEVPSFTSLLFSDGSIWHRISGYVRRFVPKKEQSDGASADYYKLPFGATQLQDLISDRNMNAQLGEIFRACYRFGRAAHSDQKRDIRKIIFYAQAELARLEKLDVHTNLDNHQ